MDQPTGAARPDLIELTADIVSAYVAKNAVPPTQIPDLIAQVHTALQRAHEVPAEAESPPSQPAVTVRKSITPDFLVCLEDGRQFRSMRRHLSTSHGMTPDQYRAKWGLSQDYPMVAPNYAAARSKLAQSMGLGQKRKSTAVTGATAAKKARRQRQRTSKGTGRAAQPAE